MEKEKKWFHINNLLPKAYVCKGITLAFHNPLDHNERCATDLIPANIMIKYLQSGSITNLHSNKTYNTIRDGNCQSHNLIYWLEYNWCNDKYASHTRNPKSLINSKIIFLTVNISPSQQLPGTLPATRINQKLPKNLSMSNSLRDQRELVWIHRLNIIITSGLNILD